MIIARVTNFATRLFQVLHLYLILGVQDLLRLWLYATSVCYSHDSDGMCHYCMYIFPAERWRLPMVSPQCFVLLLFFSFLIIEYTVTVWICFTGNGRAFLRQLRRLVMSIFTHFTISSSKPSEFIYIKITIISVLRFKQPRTVYNRWILFAECTVSSKRHFTSVTWRYLVWPWASCAEQSDTSALTLLCGRYIPQSR